MNTIELVIVELAGFALLVWSVKVFLQVSKKPIAVFNFEDATHHFEIEKPGYYSISVRGAGFIQLVQRVIIKITSDNGDALNIRVHHLAFSSTREGRKEIQCWGFSINNADSYTISFSNLAQIEAYHSTLRSKRFFESPIDHSKLRIVIHQSVKPIYELGAIIALVLAMNLILYGIFYL